MSMCVSAVDIAVLRCEERKKRGNSSVIYYKLSYWWPEFYDTNNPNSQPDPSHQLFTCFSVAGGNFTEEHWRFFRVFKHTISLSCGAFSAQFGSFSGLLHCLLPSSAACTRPASWFDTREPHQRRDENFFLCDVDRLHCFAWPWSCSSSEWDPMGKTTANKTAKMNRLFLFPFQCKPLRLYLRILNLFEAIRREHFSLQNQPKRTTQLRCNCSFDEQVKVWKY